MLLIGHRGAAAASCPENTVTSVERALRRGADGVEVDVRLTADGGLVCLHDPTPLRVAGIDVELARLTTAEATSIRLPGGGTLDTLADVAEAVGGRGRLVVELKTYGAPPGAGRLTGIAAAVELRRLGLVRGDAVVVSSFDRVALAAFALRSGIRTALVTAEEVPAAAALRWALDDGRDEVHPHVGRLLAAPASFVRDAHALGVAVTSWTVNRRTDLRRVAARGVDAAICDDPATARSALEPAAAVGQPFT